MNQSEEDIRRIEAAFPADSRKRFFCYSSGYPNVWSFIEGAGNREQGTGMVTAALTLGLSPLRERFWRGSL
jgi:hypothetical protein